MKDLDLILKHTMGPLVDKLGDIERAVKMNCIDKRVSDQPGVIEGGFMRLHDKLDSIDMTLYNTNNHLEVIAKALSIIAERAERM